MSIQIARIRIPNASMAAMNPGQAYFIDPSGSLLTANTATKPLYVWDGSPYRAIKLIASVGSPGMTSASAGTIGLQPSVLPDWQNPPAAGMPFYASADGSNQITTLAAAATTVSSNMFFPAQITGSLIGNFTLTLTFTTVPTAGADLWLYVLGWKWLTNGE
jgi:hypothetical protein